MPHAEIPIAWAANRKRMPGMTCWPAYGAMSSIDLTMSSVMASPRDTRDHAMSPRSELVETRPAAAERSRGLVSSRVSGGRVEARGYAPPDALRDVVATFWIGRWDLCGQPPHVTERVSDPCMNLVFEDGDGDAGGR